MAEEGWSGLFDGEKPHVPRRNLTHYPYRGGDGSGTSVAEYDVSKFGAVGDGVTDDSASIQAAIDAASVLGGGRILLDAKVYLVQSGIRVATNHIQLIGIGGGDIFRKDTDGTVLRGNASTSAILTLTAETDAAHATSGFYAEGILFDGNGQADTCVHLEAAVSPAFFMCHFQGAVQQEVYFGYGTGSASLKQVYRPLFDSCTTHSVDSAHGFVLDGEAGGSGGNRTTFGTFLNCHSYHEDGNAWELIDCDTNTWFGCGVSRGTGTGYGFHLKGDQVETHDVCENNAFFGCHGGPGGWYAHGDNCNNNIAIGVLTTDGSPIVVEDGADLFFINEHGVGFGWRLLDVYDFSIDGAANHFDVLNLDGYSEIMVIIKDVSLAASGFRWIKFGADDGNSWYEGSTAVSQITNAGVETTTNWIQTHFTASADARTAVCTIEGWNSEGANKIARTTDRAHVLNHGGVFDSIRIFGLGEDYTSPVNFAGGTIQVFGRL